MSLLNVIRCDLPQKDYLVWKWQPEKGSQLRQNQIRFGSSLRVRAGEIAVFFYSTGGGASPIDYIEGPADSILETKNLPVIANIIGLAYGGDSPFQAEVYFINKGQATQLKWGVPYFDAFDPRFPDFPVPVCANGTITLQISDVKRFVEVQRLEDFDPDKLRDQILPQLRTAIKSNIVNLATARGIPLVQIGGRVEDLSVILQPTASKVLEGFGVALRNFVVEGVEANKGSDGFKDLMKITRDQVLQNIQTQGDVGRKSMVDAQEINVQHIAESQRIQRKQSELHVETEYLPAHQVDLQADVAKTAAESLGQIGSGGGGGEGGSGGGGGVFGGLGAAALTMGMALPVGQAFGQQIVGGMQKVSSPAVGGAVATCTRCNVPLQLGAKFCPACGTPVAAAPAPAPASAPASRLRIHVARGKQPMGIFDIQEVNRKIGLGEFNRTDLAWYVGQAQWQQLPTISGVVFPPEIPSDTPPPL
jgi:membrane protease subunit (stomatin/prohibitin family)